MDIFLEALPALGSAWGQILQPLVLGYLVMGVCMGLAIGVFPGLGGIAGLSLLLPFMFGMDPILGLALMIGMVAVVPTSDTFASVLMGIPGSSASQATVLDGFPMAKKGQAARALSAAFASSLFGGLVGAAFLTFFILVARPLVLKFTNGLCFRSLDGWYSGRAHRNQGGRSRRSWYIDRHDRRGSLQWRAAHVEL
jgi:putative tricarboxylic transport membrane protein